MPWRSRIPTRARTRSVPIPLSAANAIITVAGDVGSGKSAVSRLLGERLGLDHLSTGRLFRSIAEQRGLSVRELNESAFDDPSVDREVDDHLRAIAHEPRPLVIDSRMAWHFVPDSFKAYLVVDPHVGASRIFDASRDDEKYGSRAVAEEEAQRREAAETARYRALYGVDGSRWSNYDVVIDTTALTPEGTARLLIAALLSSTTANSRCKEEPVVWYSPRRLLPTRDLDRHDLELATQVWSEAGPAAFPPVCLAVVDGLAFVVDGHRRVAAAIRAEEPVIGGRLMNGDGAEVIGERTAADVARDGCSTERIVAWESTLDITVRQRPPWA